MSIGTTHLKKSMFLKTFPERISNDVFRKLHVVPPTSDKNLWAAVNWIKRAHDASDDDGVSYGYYLRPLKTDLNTLGWRESYVETSGYIIETLYDIGQHFDDQNATERAERIGHWLLSVQNEDGSFANDNYNKGVGIVFDTGQVLFGLARCFKETQNPVFQVAGEKAALWLASVMDEDGAWRQNTHKGAVNTYNTRVAWSMLEFDAVSPNKVVYDAACRNLDWAMTQQVETGFFENCAFGAAEAAFTHTIAYAIRGLMEGGRLTGDERYTDSALKAAKAVQAYVKDDGFLAGRISIEGKALEESSCLTGNCQMAIIWYYLAKLSQDPSLSETADKTMNYVMSVQDIETRDGNVNGAIKGSHPIWGKYTPFAYPNWATKFFIEALLYKGDIL